MRRLLAAAWVVLAVPVLAAAGGALLSLPGPGLLAAVLGSTAGALAGLGGRRAGAVGAAVAALAGAALGGSLLSGALILGLALGAHALIGALAARIPEDLPMPARWVRMLWGAGVLLALFQLTRLGAFLADPAQTWGSLAPGIEEVTRHSCLTAYVHGARLAVAGMDPFDPALAPLAMNLSAPLPPTAAGIAPFTLDMFGYAPPFLLLPQALMVVSGEFLVLRPLFAALSLLLWGGLLWELGRVLGGTLQRRLLWLAPLATASIPCYISLQFGNASLLLVVLCAYAWLSMQRDRPGVAGAAIAFATYTRYTPALLGLVVLGQRRWRVVGAGALAAVLFAGASALVSGPGPWRFFFETHLPLMRDGSALSFLDNDSLQIAANVAPFGIPFKLRELGLGDWGWPEAQRISTLFALALVGLSLAAARHQKGLRSLQAWSALVALGLLQSSFSGTHVMIAVVFVLLVLAPEVRTRPQAALYAGAWGLFALWPLPAPRAIQLGVGVVQVVALLLMLSWLILRSPERGGDRQQSRQRANR